MLYSFLAEFLESMGLSDLKIDWMALKASVIRSESLVLKDAKTSFKDAKISFKDAKKFPCVSIKKNSN